MKFRPLLLPALGALGLGLALYDPALAQAMQAFMQVLDSYTLADLMTLQIAPKAQNQALVFTRMVAGKLHSPQLRKASVGAASKVALARTSARKN